jgi:hypothetical protein
VQAAGCCLSGHKLLHLTCGTVLGLRLVCSKMTEDEVAASRAALEHGAADDAAIMQLIAAFMCGGSNAGRSASSEPTAAPASSQHGSNGISSSADGQHEVAAVANVLHRLSAHDSARHSPQNQQSLDRPAAANGRSGCTAADMIASGQFDWAGGLPQTGAASAQGSTGSGMTEQQDASAEQQRLPAGGSAEAAQAMLSGQFQWGGSSTPQPLPAAPLEAVTFRLTGAMVA